MIFNSKYPILEACMNRGSTIELALAVHDAGAYPSLCSWSYDGNVELFEKDIKTFINETKSNNIHISFQPDERLSSSDLNEKILNLIYEYNIPTIEVIFGKYNSLHDEFKYRNLESENFYDKKIISFTEPLYKKGITVLQRTTRLHNKAHIDKYHLHGLCIKGNGASGFTSKWSTEQLWKAQKKLTPEIILIPYGGVSTSDKVKMYLEDGALVIGVGSRFAFSKESPISETAKKKVIENTVDKIDPFIHNQKTIIYQNALRFKKSINSTDDINSTKSLMLGLYSNTEVGHVYVGNSINTITELLSCKEIVNDLMKGVIWKQII